MRLRSLPFPLGGAIVVAFVGALLALSYVLPQNTYTSKKYVSYRNTRCAWAGGNYRIGV